MQDAGYVAREMGALVAAAAQQYEASGPGPIAAPGGLQGEAARLRAQGAEEGTALAECWCRTAPSAWLYSAPVVPRTLPQTASCQ